MGEIADEHYSQMMWEHGNAYIMDSEPFADTPDFGGWRAYLLRHANDDASQREQAKHELERWMQSTRPVGCCRNGLSFSFTCKFCGQDITFIIGRPFDTYGAHRCLAEGRGRDTRPPKERLTVLEYCAPLESPNASLSRGPSGTSA